MTTATTCQCCGHKMADPWYCDAIEECECECTGAPCRQGCKPPKASRTPKQPTFICETCGGTFKATKIGGQWYGIRDEHFQAI